MSGDRFPAMLKGGYLFAWMAGSFLMALILAVLLSEPSGTYEPVRFFTNETIEAGREIFKGEGCSSCHSIMPRPADRTPGGYTETGIGLPLHGYPGSSRIGPDLVNSGSPYATPSPETRFENPQVLQPGTVMPSYSHLTVSEVNSLLSYLYVLGASSEKWKSIRELNSIGNDVPDYMLEKLSRYFNVRTGEFNAPVSDSPDFLITGQGIYNSRCAGCHGFDGSGITAPTPVPGAVTVSFQTGEFRSMSEIIIYWRITEGIAGTEMAPWGGTLSEPALWYLVGYLKKLANPYFDVDELTVEPEESIDPYLPAEIDEWSADFEEWYLPEHAGENDDIDETFSEESGDGASEEEGEFSDESGMSSDAVESPDSVSDEEDQS